MAGIVDGKFDPNNIEVFGVKVAVRKHELFHERKFGDIIVPDTHDCAVRLTKASIVSISNKATEETGLAVDDVILYDHFSAFHDTHPIAILNYENIIFQIINGEFTPLKYWVMFDAVKRSDLEKDLLIDIPEMSNLESLTVGKIVKYNKHCINSKYFVDNEHIIYDSANATIVKTTREYMTIHEKDIKGIYK